jgi:hypothetical protein
MWENPGVWILSEGTVCLVGSLKLTFSGKAVRLWESKIPSTEWSSYRTNALNKIDEVFIHSRVYCTAHCNFSFVLLWFTMPRCSYLNFCEILLRKKSWLWFPHSYLNRLLETVVQLLNRLAWAKRCELDTHIYCTQALSQCHRVLSGALVGTATCVFTLGCWQ